MLACWAIAEASDMSKDSEFLHIVAMANEDFLLGMLGSGSPTILHALHSDIMQVMLHISLVRLQWVFLVPHEKMDLEIAWR
jgi:hypothetical protein